MPVDFLNYFNLPKNFSENDLFNSYNNKLAEIDRLNISSIDKDFYKESLDTIYSKAKKYFRHKNALATVDNFSNTVNFPYFDSFINSMNNLNRNWFLSSSGNTTSSEYSQSVRSVLNPDNSTTVYEETVINTNGDVKKTIKSYKKYPNGRIENL